MHPKINVAAIAAGIATLLAVAYWLARLGFDNPPGPIFKVLSISYLLLLLPPMVSLAARRRYGARAWFLSQPAISLGTLTVLLVAGLLTRFTSISLMPFFGLIGFALFAYLAASLMLSKKRNRVLVATFFILILSIWIAGQTYGVVIFHRSLFLERMMVNQAVSLDTLFHSAISSMIETYGIPSTGLDGLPYLRYHIGSHWVFAWLSSLLGTRPIDFYQLGYPVIFIPLLIQSILSFSIDLNQRFYGDRKAGTSWKFWLIFAVAFTGPLTSYVSTDVKAVLTVWGIWTFPSLITSESYLLATTFFFIGASLLLNFSSKIADLRPLKKSESLFFLAILPPMVAILGLLKISHLLITVPLLAYAFLRFNLYRSKIMLSSAFLVLLVGGFAAFLTSSSAASSGFSIPTPEGVWLKLVKFSPVWVWVLIYVGLKMKRLAIFSLRQLKDYFSDKSLLPLEMLLLVGSLSAVPMFFMNILGDSGFFFYDIQRWLAVALILAELNALKQPKTQISCKGYPLGGAGGSRRLSALYAVPLVCICLANGMVSGYQYVQSNLQFRHKLLSLSEVPVQPPLQETTLNYLAEGKMGQLLETLRSRAAYLVNKPPKMLPKAPNYQAILELDHLSRLPLEEKRQTLLYIPEKSLYWDGWATWSAPFVGPAITGMAMIEGLPKAEFDTGLYVTKTYGYGDYAARAKTPDGDKSVTNLHLKAKTLGFPSLVIFGIKTEAK